MKKPTYDDVDGDISKFLPLINTYVKHLEETMETVHWNACTETIKACIKQWDMDFRGKDSEKEMPPHPLINKVKRL